ncbi:MAG: FAD-dependent oxidoreductase, partial [Dehalococcoidia bacterium]
IRDLKTKEKKKLDLSGIFVEIGLNPNSELVKDMTALNEQREIVVNCRNETDVPGLFAAGDVTNVSEKQIVISAGEGAKAALQAHKYLQRL